MEIKILSKANFNKYMVYNRITDANVENRKASCFISINDTAGPQSKSYFERDHANVLILHFDDTSEDQKIQIVGSDEITESKVLTLDQAKQIIDFLDKNEEKEQFIVHCSAGISRSGAVGTFILNYFEGNKHIFKNDNPDIIPNPQVLSMLNGIVWEQTWKNRTNI